MQQRTLPSRWGGCGGPLLLRARRRSHTPPALHRAARQLGVAAISNDTQTPPNGDSLALLKPPPQDAPAPLVLVRRPLPSVLILHTGGTLGMDAGKSFEQDVSNPYNQPELRHGTGGHYGGLRPGQQLHNLLKVVPELSQFANLELHVAFNKDSSRVGPREWVQLAKILHAHRELYDAFLVVHGTDTLAYTAAALSFMLAGFRKPIVLTGSQLPLLNPRTDARTNLLDAITCATAYFTPPHIQLQEVCVCFGGLLLRGNRAQKVDSMMYRAFASPTMAPLATLGVEVQWNKGSLLQPEGTYRPRFKLDANVIRIPIVPGCDPRQAYGDLVGRGVKGIVLESFGVGNMPDLPQQGWLTWLKQQRKKGLYVYLASQCLTGPMHPELYKAGSVAIDLGCTAGPRMTAESAVVKMMHCLAYPDIPLGMPIAGEM